MAPEKGKLINIEEVDLKERKALAAKIRQLWNLQSATDAIPQHIRHSGDLINWPNRALLKRVHDLAVSIPGNDGLNTFRTALEEGYTVRMQMNDEEEQGLQKADLDYVGRYVVKCSPTERGKGKQKARDIIEDDEGMFFCLSVILYRLLLICVVEEDHESGIFGSASSSKRRRTLELSDHDEDEDEDASVETQRAKKQKSKRVSSMHEEATYHEDNAESSVGHQSLESPYSGDNEATVSNGMHSDGESENPSIDDHPTTRADISEAIKETWGLQKEKKSINHALPENTWFKLKGDPACPRGIKDLVLDIETLQLFYELSRLAPTADGGAQMRERLKAKWNARVESGTVGKDRKEKEVNIQVDIKALIAEVREERGRGKGGRESGDDSAPRASKSSNGERSKAVGDGRRNGTAPPTDSRIDHDTRISRSNVRSHLTDPTRYQTPNNHPPLPSQPPDRRLTRSAAASQGGMAQTPPQPSGQDAANTLDRITGGANRFLTTSQGQAAPQSAAPAQQKQLHQPATPAPAPSTVHESPRTHLSRPSIHTLIHDGLPPSHHIRLRFNALENELRIAELRVENIENRRRSIMVLQEHGSEMETRLEITEAQLKVAEIEGEMGKLREEAYKVLERAGGGDKMDERVG
jgi:hypothetical protein